MLSLRVYCWSPVGRNTAPAIAACALSALKDDENAILLVLSADHVIEDVKAFEKAVKSAEKLAEEGYMVTFGIKPVYAHTGYGYIEVGKEINAAQDDAYNLVKFKEKPDLKTAEKYIKNGQYLWNSGMFCFKAARYLEELEERHPDIIKHAKKSLEGAYEDLDFVRLGEEDFAKCENISIDYAVMEHTKRGAVISLDAGWNDVGSWSALWEVCEKDAHGNVVQGDVINIDTKSSFIHGADKLVCTLGLDDLIVVDTQDALLVAHKDSVQKVKDIVATLKKDDRKEQNITAQYIAHGDIMIPFALASATRLSVFPLSRGQSSPYKSTTIARSTGLL